MLQDVSGKVLDGQHRFLTRWLNLGFRENKAISAFIPEFEGKGIFDSLVISPVVRAPSSRICNVQTAEKQNKKPKKLKTQEGN